MRVEAVEGVAMTHLIPIFVLAGALWVAIAWLVATAFGAICRGIVR